MMPSGKLMRTDMRVWSVLFEGSASFLAGRHTLTLRVAATSSSKDADLSITTVAWPSVRSLKPGQLASHDRVIS